MGCFPRCLNRAWPFSNSLNFSPQESKYYGSQKTYITPRPRNLAPFYSSTSRHALFERTILTKSAWHSDMANHFTGLNALEGTFSRLVPASRNVAFQLPSQLQNQVRLHFREDPQVARVSLPSFSTGPSCWKFDVLMLTHVAI